MAYRPSKSVSIPLAALVTFAGGYAMTPPQRSGAQVPPPAAASAGPGTAQSLVSTTYYAGCNEARAAGAAPIYRGQPGYRPEMDGDDDGIACEPYHGR